MTNRNKQRQGENVRVGARRRARACALVCLRVKSRLGSACRHVDVNANEDAVRLNKAKVNTETEKGRIWSPALMTFHLQTFIWLSVIVERKDGCLALYGPQCKPMLTARMRRQLCVCVCAPCVRHHTTLTVSICDSSLV